jgi:hypothetical protein
MDAKVMAPPNQLDVPPEQEVKKVSVGEVQVVENRPAVVVNQTIM